MASEFDAYLSQLRHQRGLSERTLALYTEALGKLQRGVESLGSGVLTLKPAQARELLAQLHGGGLKPSTLALTLSAWRGFYKWLALQKKIDHDPLVGLKAPKRGRPLPKALAVDDAVALAEAEPEGEPALQARDHALVELLYGAGLRIGELLALDLDPRAPSHVDLANDEIQVVGKGSKPRRVPLGAQARKAVEAWVQQRALIAKPEEPALFVGGRGQRLQPGVARKQLAALARSAGLPTHVHPHMLRHSYASHLLQSSGDLRGVQELLGHANISTTQVYTRLDWQHLAKVYDAAHPRAKRNKP